MPYRQPLFQTPVQRQANEPVQGPQQPFAMPAFEAPRTSPTARTPPSAEQPVARALSPFEVQQLTLGQQAPRATPQARDPQPRAQQPGTAIPLQQFPTPQPAAATPFQPRTAFSATPGATSPQPRTLQGVPAQTPGTPTRETASPQQGFSAGPSPETFGGVGQGFQTQVSGTQTPRQPPLDIHDAGESLEIEVELPGVSKKNIRLVSQPHGLELRATAKQRQTDDLVQSERGQRVFQRSIPVGFEVDPKKVSARFENGILTVSVPKDAAKGERAIEIK